MSSRGINKVILIGNLGADPETRYMPSGGAVTNIRLATSEQWNDKQTGQPQERTEWHRVVCFNRLGEIELPAADGRLACRPPRCKGRYANPHTHTRWRHTVGGRVRAERS